MPRTRAYLRAIETDTLVVGAGQAGLAAAYYLQRAGADYHVLEALPRVGDAWRRRWAGLRLFTPNRYNGLPGSPFPGAAYELPSRLAVADYLEGYARVHGLRVVTHSPLVSLRQNPRSGGFEVETENTNDGSGGGTVTWRTRDVVLATGAYRSPRVPGFAERLPPALPHVHAAQLRDPAAWLPRGARHLLIVGAGASGHQLAVQFAGDPVRPDRITLAGRDPGHLPRRVLGRDVYDYLYGLGLLPLRVDRAPGRWLARTPTKGEIRVGEGVDRSARRHGIGRVGRIRDFAGGRFLTEEGTEVDDVDAVVFATGYRNRYDFLDVPGALDGEQRPRHRLGVSPVPGLYWLGLHLMRRVNSSLLGGVGADAREVVHELLAARGLDRAGLA